MAKCLQIAVAASAAYQRGEYPLARELAQQMLDSAPADIGAMLILGNVLYLEQNYLEADFYYQKILVLQAYHMEALVNHGEALLHQNKYAAAKEVATLLGDVQAGILLRSKIAFAEEDFAAAEDGFARVLECDKTDFWVWNLLSQAAQKNNHFEQALDAAWQAVELSRGADSQHLNLAYALYEIALETGVEKVLPWLQKWHQNYAQNGIVEQSWHAFFADEKFTKANSDYVRQVFDNFADSFEETLTNLDYRAPEIIASEVKQKCLSFLPQKARILDAGCGTGLCASYLDSLFENHQLFGVDLSPKMLEQAAAKGLYFQLENQDIEAYLSTHKNEFDLIVAADVLTYFGTLEKISYACFESLHKQGCFVFSITQNNLNYQPWYQHLSGRFVHSENYVRNMLLQSGFEELSFVPCTLRLEGEKEVLGWVISAFKRQKKSRQERNFFNAFSALKINLFRRFFSRRSL